MRCSKMFQSVPLFELGTCPFQHFVGECYSSFGIPNPRTRLNSPDEVFPIVLLLCGLDTGDNMRCVLQKSNNETCNQRRASPFLRSGRVEGSPFCVDQESPFEAVEM